MYPFRKKLLYLLKNSKKVVSLINIWMQGRINECRLQFVEFKLKIELSFPPKSLIGTLGSRDFIENQEIPLLKKVCKFV